MRLLFFFLCIAVGFSACRTNETPAAEVAEPKTELYREKHRLQGHFSPPSNWMNDPNGMVFYDGEYHLFYQHYPDSNVWGPMHWGHAISKDLVKWENHPIALYPDSLGMIFSGSAVVDSANTSGLGTKENPPLVAMYTYHSAEKEKAGRIDYQTQGIAFSTDKGRTWTKYDGNPVIKNPGIRDFRDPKVIWHKETKQWVVALAVQDHIQFWSSPDLKNWKKLSEFGKDYGAHGGVWECPDLFQLTAEEDGKSKWILFVSINPGGPNGGSATQYFPGEFNGRNFTTDVDKSASQWIDYGPDNYAGVTFFNAPQGRRIFIGWMSNWDYANVVPTVEWRSAATTPRDLSLAKINNKYFVKSAVSPEYLKSAGEPQSFSALSINDTLSLPVKSKVDFSLSVLRGEVEAKTFSMEFFNSNGELVVVGFDEKENTFFLDRSKSGKTDFSKGFRGRATAPRISGAKTISYTVVTDASSVEVFFDDGLSVLTGIFFPEDKLSEFRFKAPAPVKIDKAEVRELRSIW
jgi:fructan beta-fructosidase